MIRYLLISLAGVFLLTACPKQDEVRAMMAELNADRNRAIELIESRDFRLDDLLEIQNYFFHVGERIHLLHEDPETLKNIRKYQRRRGAKQFCEDFVLPQGTWKKLDRFCAKGEIYRCSADIRNYEVFRAKLFSALEIEACP